MPISFDPYTTPQHNQAWNPPISEGLLAQGYARQDADLKEKQNLFNQEANSIFGIQTSIPQDAQILQAKKQAFQEGIKNIKVNDLTNPQTQSQINQFVSQYENDPDILGIAQRASAINKEQSIKKEYESKGKNYVSPLLRQASDYINQGTYLRDTRFNKEGFVAPENKELDETFKNVPEYENWIKNGAYDDHLKGKAIGSLQSAAYNLFKTDPQWQKLHKDNFEQQVDGQDLNSYLDNPTQAISDLFPHLPPSSQPQAIQYIKNLQSLKDNPYAQSAIKSRLEDLYLQDQAYKAAEAHTFANTVDYKVNEFSKLAVEHKYRLEEEANKENFKISQKIDNVKNQSLKSFYSRYYTVTGKAPVDDAGNLIEPKDLPDIPSLKDLKVSAQKASTKDKGEKTLENTLSDAEQGFISAYDKPVLEGALTSRYRELGFPDGTTIKNVTVDNGQIKFDVDIPGLDAFSKNKPKTTWSAQEIREKFGLGTTSTTSNTKDPLGILK